LDDVVRRSSTVGALVVAVPAQNEELRIAASVKSILAAAAATDPRIAIVVSVATDNCTDGTVALLEGLADHSPLLRIVSGSWNSAGRARHAAVSHGLHAVSLTGHAPGDTWIATTDADTQVPNDWLTRQLHLAELGYDAVAGTVELADDDDRSDELLALFARNYSVHCDGTHTHVHGANMGMRASAYLAAGGFPAVTTSEDRLLWNELLRLNYRAISPVDVRVATSGRLKGRVVGGFADAMANAWT
jgi:glycosyltransferase involved in cell wall biosynthesis